MNYQDIDYPELKYPLYIKKLRDGTVISITKSLTHNKWFLVIDEQIDSVLFLIIESKIALLKSLFISSNNGYDFKNKIIKKNPSIKGWFPTVSFSEPGDIFSIGLMNNEEIMTDNLRFITNNDFTKSIIINEEEIKLEEVRYIQLICSNDFFEILDEMMENDPNSKFSSTKGMIKLSISIYEYLKKAKDRIK